MNKTSAVVMVLALILSSSSLIIMAASCTDPPAPTVKPDIPIPSVPQFSLIYADHSYDVPEKTDSYTDPYTGKVTTHTYPRYRVQNYTIDVTIKNQPYPATINNGNTSVFKYTIQTKGHFEPEWIDQYTTVEASNSGYTVVSLPASYPVEGKVDFRVKASLGYYYDYFYGLVPFTGFASESSSWSSTQTFTMPGTSDLTSSPMPTSTVPEFPMIGILTLLVIIPLVATVILRKKRC